MEMEKIIIAVDGHSSTGKSTFAKAVAAKLGYIYVDTGALYRGVTCYALKNGLIDQNNNIDKENLKEALKSIELRFIFSPSVGASELHLNGVNIEKEIRGLEVAGRVSIVASIPFVREFVDSILHKAGEEKGVIMDGRDIGTVVFPDAEIKIFMTADPKVRAMRRYREIIAKGESADFDEVLANVIERDRLDETRETAPLRRAPDAIFLDNSEMNMDDQIVWFVNNFSDRWNLKLK